LLDSLLQEITLLPVTLENHISFYTKDYLSVPDEFFCRSRMATAADTDYDQVSLSSSCEIVDSLAEAVQDPPDLEHLENTVCEGFTQAGLKVIHLSSNISTSVPEVMFKAMQDTYTMDRDMVVEYQSMNNANYGDRVGLYRLPSNEPHEYVAFVWVNEGEGVATFDKSVLPREEGEYQLMYLQGDNRVVGTSVTFQLVKEVNCKEIGQVSASNIMSGEMLSVVRDMEEQETTNTQTTHIILSTDSDRESMVQKALKDKVKEVEILSSKLSSCEALCGDITEENKILSREKGELTSRLEKEMEEKVKRLDEMTELVDMVEQYSKQIKDLTSARPVKRSKQSSRGVRDVVRSDDWLANCSMECKTEQARRQKVVMSRISQASPIQDLSTMKSSSKVATAVQNINTSRIVTNETKPGPDQFISGEENKTEMEHDWEDIEISSTSNKRSSIVKQLDQEMISHYKSSNSIDTPSPSSPPHISKDPKMSLLLPTDPRTRGNLPSHAPTSSAVQQSVVEKLSVNVTVTPSPHIACPNSPGSPPVPDAFSIKQKRRSSFRRGCFSCGQLLLLPDQAVCCDSCLADQVKLFRRMMGRS